MAQVMTSVPGDVFELNPVTHAILNQFDIPLASCAGPQGLAIGPSSPDPTWLQCDRERQ